MNGDTILRTEYRVVSTKYRRRILNPGVKGYIRELLPKLLEIMPECEIVEQNIKDDYLHLVIIIPLRYTVRRAQ
jgi:REP element-mobilizing transposase RayT